jgi:hypothetical protein
MRQVTGICMVKDEIDIVPASIPYMMEQLDRVVVYDNGSTDGTREYLESLTGDGLIVKADRDPGYWQGRKMTRWAAEWADTTSWLIPFDADELWHCAVGQHCGEHHQDQLGRYLPCSDL